MRRRKCKQNKRYRTSARITKVLPGTGRTDRQTDGRTECNAICGTLLRRRAPHKNCTESQHDQMTDRSSGWRPLDHWASSSKLIVWQTTQPPYTADQPILTVAQRDSMVLSGYKRNAMVLSFEKGSVSLPCLTQVLAERRVWSALRILQSFTISALFTWWK